MCWAVNGFHRTRSSSRRRTVLAGSMATCSNRDRRPRAVLSLPADSGLLRRRRAERAGEERSDITILGAGASDRASVAAGAHTPEPRGAAGRHLPQRLGAEYVAGSRSGEEKLHDIAVPVR